MCANLLQRVLLLDQRCTLVVLQLSLFELLKQPEIEFLVIDELFVLNATELAEESVQGLAFKVSLVVALEDLGQLVRQHVAVVILVDLLSVSDYQS